MGNNVVLENNTNLIINTALCVVLRYYEGNQINPNVAVTWSGVGYVYFSVVMLPWYGPDSEFGSCIGQYQKFEDKIPILATNVSKYGEAELGYFKIKTTKNLTYNEAEDRIRNLAYWGDGFKVAGRTIRLWGGPPRYLVSEREIDISEHFDPIRLSLSD